MKSADYSISDKPGRDEILSTRGILSSEGGIVSEKVDVFWSFVDLSSKLSHGLWRQHAWMTQWRHQRTFKHKHLFKTWKKTFWGLKNSNIFSITKKIINGCVFVIKTQLRRSSCFDKMFLEFFHHFDEFDINKNYSFFRKVISTKNCKDAFFVKIYIHT